MQRHSTLRALLNTALVLTIFVAAFPALQATFAHPLQLPRTTAPGHLASSASISPSIARPNSAGTGIGDALPAASPQAVLSATVTVSATATAATSATVATSPTVTSSPATAPSVSATATPTVPAVTSATAATTGTATPSGTTTAVGTGSTTDSSSPTATVTALDSATPSSSDSGAVAADYAQLPLAFEPNRGQVDPSVQFQAHGPGYTVYLTANEAVLGLFPSTTTVTNTTLLPNGRPAPPPFATVTPAAVLHFSLVGANPQATLAGQEPLPGDVNYFYGSDPSGWLTNIPTYAEVAYQNVYPGIDMLYHGRQNQLEYDFNVQPGADPSQIHLQIAGADAVQLDGKGNLVLTIGSVALTEDQPRVYQVINGVQVPVGVRYTLLGNGQVGFALGSFDSLHPLVIDPVLSYSTYLGGTSFDAAQGIAIDGTGAAYLTGYTMSTTFPVTGTTIIQNTNGGHYDAFVSKLNSTGNALVYSTYLGGSSNDYGEGIAVDSSGSAYMVGYSSSTNYPTSSAYQSTNWGNPNIVLSKLAANGGSLTYSTYLGGSGSDYGTGVTVDGSGYAYVTGYSGTGLGGHTFPTTAGAYQTVNTGGTSAIVTKFAIAGTSLVYSTYIGGSGGSYGNAIALDSSGEAYITGNTPGAFPTTAGAYQTTNHGSNDAFISRLNSTGTSLLSSTYLGGTSDDYGQGIKIDSSGNPYITGYTSSSGFPTTAGVYQTSNPGTSAFVSKLNSTLTTLSASTFLGGGGDFGMGIALDGSNNPYIAGYTGAANFPLASPLDGNFVKYTSGLVGAFMSELNASLTTLSFSTFLDGWSNDYGMAIATDSSGNSYVAGQTQSPNFPTKGGIQGSFAGYYDAFVTKVGTGASATASSGAIPWHPHYNVNFDADMGAAVDLADGHVDVSADDIHIAGRGPSLDLSHTWDSTQAAVGGATWAGQGWNTDLTQSMSGVSGGTVRYTDPTGALWIFTYSGGAYVTPAGLPWRLTTTSTTFTLTNILTGDVRSFNAQGNLSSLSDSYGNSNSISLSTPPTSETNSGGRSITLAYNSGQLLGDVQSPLWRSTGGTQTVAGTQGQHISYAYQGQQLTTLTRAALTGDAVIDHFAYTGNQLTTVTTPLTMEGTLAVTETWTLAYDGSGRVSSITSPISGTVGQAGYTPAYTTTFTYNAGNTVVIEGYGTTAALTMTYSLDGQGQATQITDGLSHSNIYTFDADHDVLTAKDGNNNTTTNYYKYVGPTGSGGIASTGLMTQTILPAIHPNYPTSTLTAPTTNYVYDPTSYDLTELYDNLGAATFYTYNGSHDISSTAVLTGTTVVGPTTYYHWRGQTESYDSYGEPLTTMDGRGLTVPDTTSLTAPTITPNAQAANYTHSWTYFSQGDLKTSTTPPITTTLGGTTTTGSVTTQYTYDGDGDQITMVSADGNTTTYGYDRLGRQNSVKQPPLSIVGPPAGGPTTLQPLSKRTFDGNGNVSIEMDGNGADVFDSYDPLGRPTLTYQPLTPRTVLDPKVAAMSATTIMTYTATNMSATRDPQGNVTTNTYDAASRLTYQVNGAGQQWTYSYDNANNLTSLKQGNPVSPTTTTTWQYDALNRASSKAVSGTGLSSTLTTYYSYDLHGNLVRQQDPNNDTSFGSYDLVDQLTHEEIDPSAPNTPTGTNQETFSYDLAGNRIGSVDFRGGTTTLTQDGDSRQTAQSDSYSGVPTISTNASFDPDGNLVGQSQTIGGVTHTFGATLNPADWPKQATNDNLTSSTTGAGAGDVLQQTIQNGSGNVVYNIDQAGRANMIGVTSVGSTTPLTTTFNFNNEEQLIAYAPPNSIEQDVAYDGANRLSQITAQNTVNHTLLNNSYQYGYDTMGLTAAITTTIQGSATSQTISHDAQGRLTSVSGTAPTGNWTYDGRGNLQSATSGSLTKNYTYVSSNPEELSTTSGTGLPTVTYSYDGAGNTTTIAATGVHTVLSYDAQGRLIQVTLGSPITETITLTYNAFGQRASYTVTPTGAGSPSLNEVSQYQGDQLSQVAYTGTSITTPYTDTYVYTQDGQPMELLRVQSGTTTPYWYMLDGQNNVVALSNQSGSVVDSYSYDQWGKLLGSSESVPQQLRYDGYWYDNELGWYWLTVRPYDPVLERFLQPDPSENEGLFQYVYALDNPSDLDDPTGLVTNPVQMHCLLTADDNDECNVAVGSAQWNNEVGSGGASPIAGVNGSDWDALAPQGCQAQATAYQANDKATAAGQVQDYCTVDVKYTPAGLGNNDPGGSSGGFLSAITSKGNHEYILIKQYGLTPMGTVYLTEGEGTSAFGTIVGISPEIIPEQEAHQRYQDIGHHILTAPGSCDPYLRKFSEFATAVNHLPRYNRPYSFIGQNSNAYAHAAVLYAGLNDPGPPWNIFLPGWDEGSRFLKCVEDESQKPPGKHIALLNLECRPTFFVVA